VFLICVGYQLLQNKLMLNVVTSKQETFIILVSLHQELGKSLAG
jgi:hypothetical protein